MRCLIMQRSVRVSGNTYRELKSETACGVLAIGVDAGAVTSRTSRANLPQAEMEARPFGPMRRSQTDKEE